MVLQTLGSMHGSPQTFTGGKSSDDSPQIVRIFNTGEDNVINMQVVNKPKGRGHKQQNQSKMIEISVDNSSSLGAYPFVATDSTANSFKVKGTTSEYKPAFTTRNNSQNLIRAQTMPSGSLSVDLKKGNGKSKGDANTTVGKFD